MKTMRTGSKDVVATNAWTDEARQASAEARASRKSLQEEGQSPRESHVGKRVMIIGGMKEFHGKTGRISHIEGEGRDRAYRVHLESPVHVAGVGKVHSDLWQGHHLVKEKQQ